jgi:signal transduction histidine kinase
VLFRSLINNAVKYTYPEGEIALSAEQSGKMLVIAVKDNGTGVPQDIKDKLFKLSAIKSRPGTNSESGTGLGLVLCAEFVKANGGEIWFESEEGKGAAFFFSVPVSL